MVIATPTATRFFTLEKTTGSGLTRTRLFGVLITREKVACEDNFDGGLVTAELVDDFFVEGRVFGTS
jgi:hypothetical protein